MFDDCKTGPLPDISEKWTILSGGNTRKWQGLQTLPLPSWSTKDEVNGTHKIDLLLH